MLQARQILNELHAIRIKGYGPKLPGEHDARFITLAELYASCNTTEREAIRDGVNVEFSSLLIGFSGRLAIVAERTSNQRLVFLALLAHAIEDFRTDRRDNIIALALVNHVIRKLGDQPSELFKAAALLSSARGAAELRAFNDRPAELKSLKVMGMAESQTEDGVDYWPIDMPRRF